MNKRYEIREQHKVLHVFDTHFYSVVDSFFLYEMDKAVKRVDWLNSRKN